MLKFLFGNINEQKASELVGKPFLPHPDVFLDMTYGYKQLNGDNFFEKALREVDKCDIPMKNVARDLLTEDTHAFKEVSTGVKTLWLMSFVEEGKYLFKSCWLGENCYQLLFDLSKERDIYLYDNSEMLSFADRSLSGEFEDYYTGRIVRVDDHEGFDYMIDMGYNGWLG